MLILASQSAARNALLVGAGLDFESRPAPIDERAIEASMLGKPAATIAGALAEAKALAVSEAEPQAMVIGADQTLGFEPTLHKPTDSAEARRQLLLLRGKTHRLHAGVALARDGALLWSDVDTATLLLRNFSDNELDATLAAEGEAILGAVGGYRLEGPSIGLFERIEGDYFTILGLPLLPLLAALRRLAPQYAVPKSSVQKERFT